MNSFKISALSLSFVLLFTASCQHGQKDLETSRNPAQSTSEKSSLLDVFDAARKLYKQADTKQKKILTALGEAQVIGILSKENLLDSKYNSSQLVQKLADLGEKNTSPELVTALPSLNPEGGYFGLTIDVSHPYYKNNKLVPASDLRKVWKDFIASAKKQLIMNVYEFDLEVIAEELAKKANSGVDVTVGVDSKNILGDKDHVLSPEAKRVYNILSRSKVKLVPVETTSLNHQKMVAIDWETPAQARVLFSSGNLTQSCLGPEGDLADIPAKDRPAGSIPNANHVMTMKSGILSQLVHHELTKTLSKEYFYRAKKFPISGSFKISGPRGSDQSVIIAFTPGGSFRNVNKNLLGPIIRNTSGPVRMIQFAFSSDETGNNLLHSAQKEFRKGKNFDILAVGEAAFSMQGWSEYLIMSGLKVSKTGKTLLYEDDTNNAWFKAMNPTQLKSLRSKIFVAPENYKTITQKINGTARSFGAVIHHKVMSVGPYAVLGTSFNLSDAAEDNHEQILIFKDQALADVVDGMTRYLTETSRTVIEDALRRNKN